MANAASTIPAQFDIEHYGGDTLTIRVFADETLTAGREWLGQLRATKTSDVIDATFIITPSAAPGEPTFAMLSTVDTSRLIASAPLRTERRVINNKAVNVMVASYSGVYDIQVAGVGGIDPVTTLVWGNLTMEQDVSREPAV